MIEPKIPANEENRLKALNSLNILDTVAEERFDRITRIARQVFNVPVALISLISKDKQWLKSKQGIDATETSRSVSFCGHTILNDNIMVVEDASKDARFHDNPFVLSEPHIRFYSGCPLKIKQQYIVGTLCVIDSKSRQFTEQEQVIMRDLADIVQAELELMHLSTTDELTHLTNRRGFLSVGEHIFQLNQRNQTPMILLFFDLNKFKRINDTYGHAEGDEVLKAFAGHLLHNFRRSDVLARLGGDEFCALCSNLSENDVSKLLDRLNNAMKKSQNMHKLEYSVGYLAYDPIKHYTLKDMIEDADTKMYQHKREKGLLRFQ